MAYHSKPSAVSLISGIDNFINQLDRKKSKIMYLLLGLKLIQIGLKGEKIFSQGSTNLGMVLDHIKSNKNGISAGSVIITDGQANLEKK